MSAESVITKHLPGWPQGSPSALREAANCWITVANGLRASIGTTNTNVGSLGTSWKGDAKDAFEQEWQKLAAAVDQACDEMGTIAASLNRAADKLESAQHAYEVAVGAAAVTAVVGIALTVVSFGTSDAAAGAAAEGEVAVAVEVATEAASAVSAALSSAASLAVQFAERFVILFGANLIAQGGISAVVYPDHNPIGHLNWGSAFSTAAGMALPLGGQGWLARVAIAGAGGAGVDAVTQEITTGKIDPGEVLFNGALAAGGTAIMIGGSKIFTNIPPGDADFPGPEARAKVPAAWGEGKPNSDGVGQRWQDPSYQGNGIRIDQANPDSPWPSQQVDHVVVRKGGKILGPDGIPIQRSLSKDYQAHIPLSEWLKWRSWDAP